MSVPPSNTIQAPTQREPRAVIEAIYAAVEAGDHATTRDLLDPALAWRQAGSVVPAAGEDREGADALLEQVVRPLERDWEGFSEQVDELLQIGDRVVATGIYHGRHRTTGRELRAEFCHLWQVRDDAAVAFRQYTDTAAFAAALEQR